MDTKKIREISAELSDRKAEHDKKLTELGQQRRNLEDEITTTVADLRALVSSASGDRYDHDYRQGELNLIQKVIDSVVKKSV